MQIQINAKPMEVPDNCNLTALLELLGFADKPVVIEHNKEAIFPRDYPAVFLQDGDKLEIISIAAGG